MSGKGGPPVDLARERRIRAALDELRALLDADPALAERTRAMLAGELPCPDLEEKETMPNDAAINLRVPKDVLSRADALMPALAQDPMLQAAGRGVSRSVVLRLAVLRGLDSLEAEYGGGKSSKGSR